MISGPADIYCTAFLGEQFVASGTLEQVVSSVKDVIAEDKLSQILIFDDATSKQIEVDFRGTKDSVLERLVRRTDSDAMISHSESETSRPVGRPKLGVVSKEVTLLPRHWEWLKSQPGGASVTLRKLIDGARRVHAQQDTVRSAQEATYRFMTAMAGNRDHYEEALRALYAGDSQRFHEFIDGWASDVRGHIKTLAARAFPEREVNE